MTHRNALVALLLSACDPHFTTVDSACHDVVPGGDEGTLGAEEAFGRMNCYRRLAGLDRGAIDEIVQTAVQSHVQYMDEHGEASDTEDPTGSGYTGADPFERLLAAGLGSFDFSGVGLWSAYWVEEDLEITPSELVDEWAADPYWRQIVLQPAWIAGGYGQVGEYVYMNILYEFPASEHVGSPVIYPTDGQVDVPTRWQSPYAFSTDDGIPDLVDVGYPITMTIGSSHAVGSWAEANPYFIQLQSASLTGPNGEVELITVTPESEAPLPLAYGVILVPAEPLEPDATYTFEASISWIDGDDDVLVRFHTL